MYGTSVAPLAATSDRSVRGALLGYGRRLYWAFVAGVGFLTGLALGPRLLSRSVPATFPSVEAMMIVFADEDSPTLWSSSP